MTGTRPHADAAPVTSTDAQLESPTLEDDPLRRIGVLGGIFDPPHIGHLWLAALAEESLKLDRVLFMPASQPPHKAREAISGVADRLLMTRLAIEGDPVLQLTAIEMERPGPSYTIDSLLELERVYGPEAQLYLCLLYTSPSPRDRTRSRMPSSA